MKSFFKFLFWIALLAGVLYVIGWAFLFEAHTAEDNVMAPNIVRGDKFLVYTRASLDTASPALCEHPDDEGQYVLGRIIGTGGDTVAFSRGNLQVNGSPVDTTVEGEYVLVDDRNTGAPQTVQLREQIETLGMIRYRIIWPRRGDRRSRRRRMRERTVPDGTFFLLADNRAFGEDSRVYGPVESSGCIGRPLLIYHPAETSGDAGSESRWFDIIR